MIWRGTPGRSAPAGGYTRTPPTRLRVFLSQTMLRRILFAIVASVNVITALPEFPSGFERRVLQSKTCHAVAPAQCGTDMGEDTCLKCAPGTTYDCEQCCPGLKRTTIGGYSFCEPAKGPSPSPPPTPPHSRCAVTLEELCGAAQKRGTTVCDNCLKAHWHQLATAACSLKSTEEFCSGGPAPPPPPSPPGTYECWLDQCYEGKGTLSKSACEASCGGPKPPPSPPGGLYTCYDGTCYEKSTGTMTKAECESKCQGPAPGPPPGGDSWETYTVAGMQVQSVIGGPNNSSYEKVIILLHGGGEDGSMWPAYYSQGWFGTPGRDLDGLKYVFPTSPDHLWYQSYKNGCGLLDDCAYNLSSISHKASMVRALIDHEMAGVGNIGSKVYLAGFSEGAQMTGYMQLVNLPFALGGVVVMDGFPLPRE